MLPPPPDNVIDFPTWLDMYTESRLFQSALSCNFKIPAPLRVCTGQGAPSLKVQSCEPFDRNNPLPRARAHTHTRAGTGIYRRQAQEFASQAIESCPENERRRRTPTAAYRSCIGNFMAEKATEFTT